MQDGQMHDNEVSNAWGVLQRSKELNQRPKELNQRPKEDKLNHRNPSSSKQNDCLE